MSISNDDIFKAADTLDAAGQSPTLAAVRKALGGGSFTTISEPLNEWKAKKAAKKVVHREPPPAAVSDQLHEMGLEIWSEALLLANGRMEAERQSLVAARAEIEAARKEATEMADQMNLELEEAKKHVAALTAEHASMQGEIEQLKGQLIESSERAAHAQARTSEISLRVDDLNTQLARVNTQNSDLIQALSMRTTDKDPEKSAPSMQTGSGPTSGTDAGL
jgi:chromosome segregation ATPase